MLTFDKIIFTERNICLAEAGIKLSEVDFVCFYDKPFLKFERLLETYYGFAPKGIQSFVTAIPVWLREKMFLKRVMREELETLPGYEAGLFIAMVAPVATPREIVTRMHAEIARIMQAPDVKTRLAQLGDEIAVSATPEQFTAFLKSEFAKWDRIIKEAGIKVD